MDYILRGNDKDVANVIKEQRIRVGRGMISFIPISECSLITEEESARLLEEQLAEKDAEIAKLALSIKDKESEIAELTASIEAKEKAIAEFATERDNMNARIAELESCITDTKELPAGDSKELVLEEFVNQGEGASDTVDNKDVVLEDQKKVGRPKKSK